MIANGSHYCTSRMNMGVWTPLVQDHIPWLGPLLSYLSLLVKTTKFVCNNLSIFKDSTIKLSLFVVYLFVSMTTTHQTKQVSLGVIK